MKTILKTWMFPILFAAAVALTCSMVARAQDHAQKYYPACGCYKCSMNMEDEFSLKGYVRKNECRELDKDEKPGLKIESSYHCYYKEYGVSCSSVNEDCKYLEAAAVECDKADDNCKYASDKWNRPMEKGAKPILYADIKTPSDVIVREADQEHTSLKPIKHRLKFTHEDTEVWWREVYFRCSEGDEVQYPYSENSKKLITHEGGDDWIRGEYGQEFSRGNECKYDVRLGYYIYRTEVPKVDQPPDMEHEAEWALPAESPEKWRER